MSFPLFIANRYVRSNRNSKLASLVSTITIVGIAVGVAVVIIAVTILDGFEIAVKEKIVNFNSHIVISGFSNRNLPESEEVYDKINNTVGNDLYGITPFISKSVIIKANNVVDGVLLYGINEESKNFELSDYIIEGTLDFSNKSDKPGIVLGNKLASKFSLSIGDNITIIALSNDKRPSFENPPVIKQFSLIGIYESGMAEYDDLKAYISFSFAQNFFRLNGLVSGYNVKLNNIDNIDPLSESLQDELGYPFYVRTIFKQHQNIFTWLELQKKPIPIILGMIILVALFNIVGTVLIIVLEKTSAIGVLKSLGSSRKQILKIFILHGLSISAMGILLGNVLALLLSLLQEYFQIVSLSGSVYFLSSVPISIDIFNYMIISSSAFIVSIATSIIPSYIASKLSPVKAIRFQ